MIFFWHHEFYFILFNCVFVLISNFIHILHYEGTYILIGLCMSIMSDAILKPVCCKEVCPWINFHPRYAQQSSIYIHYSTSEYNLCIIVLSNMVMHCSWFAPHALTFPKGSHFTMTNRAIVGKQMELPFSPTNVWHN